VDASAKPTATAFCPAAVELMIPFPVQPLAAPVWIYSCTALSGLLGEV
jgi:hypothetical protein